MILNLNEYLYLGGENDLDNDLVSSKFAYAITKCFFTAKLSNVIHFFPPNKKKTTNHSPIAPSITRI